MSLDAKKRNKDKVRFEEETVWMSLEDFQKGKVKGLHEVKNLRIEQDFNLSKPEHCKFLKGNKLVMPLEGYLQDDEPAASSTRKLKNKEELQKIQYKRVIDGLDLWNSELKAKKRLEAMSELQFISKDQIDPGLLIKKKQKDPDLDQRLLNSIINIPDDELRKSSLADKNKKISKFNDENFDPVQSTISINIKNDGEPSQSAVMHGENQKRNSLIMSFPKSLSQIPNRPVTLTSLKMKNVDDFKHKTVSRYVRDEDNKVVMKTDAQLQAEQNNQIINQIFKHKLSKIIECEKPTSKKQYEEIVNNQTALFKKDTLAHFKSLHYLSGASDRGRMVSNLRDPSHPKYGTIEYKKLYSELYEDKLIKKNFKLEQEKQNLLSQTKYLDEKEKTFLVSFKTHSETCRSLKESLNKMRVLLNINSHKKKSKNDEIKVVGDEYDKEIRNYEFENVNSVIKQIEGQKKKKTIFIPVNPFTDQIEELKERKLEAQAEIQRQINELGKLFHLTNIYVNGISQSNCGTENFLKCKVILIGSTGDFLQPASLDKGKSLFNYVVNTLINYILFRSSLEYQQTILIFYSKNTDSEQREIQEEVELTQKDYQSAKEKKNEIKYQLKQHYVKALNKEINEKNPKSLFWTIIKLLNIKEQITYNIFPDYLEEKNIQCLIQIAKLEQEKSDKQAMMRVIQNSERFQQMQQNYNKKIMQMHMNGKKQRNNSSISFFSSQSSANPSSQFGIESATKLSLVQKPVFMIDTQTQKHQITFQFDNQPTHVNESIISKQQIDSQFKEIKEMEDQIRNLVSQIEEIKSQEFERLSVKYLRENKDCKNIFCALFGYSEGEKFNYEFERRRAKVDQLINANKTFQFSQAVGPQTNQIARKTHAANSTLQGSQNSIAELSNNGSLSNTKISTSSSMKNIPYQLANGYTTKNRSSNSSLTENILDPVKHNLTQTSLRKSMIGQFKSSVDLEGQDMQDAFQLFSPRIAPYIKKKIFEQNQLQENGTMSVGVMSPRTPNNNTPQQFATLLNERQEKKNVTFHFSDNLKNLQKNNYNNTSSKQQFEFQNSKQIQQKTPFLSSYFATDEKNTFSNNLLSPVNKGTRSSKFQSPLVSDGKFAQIFQTDQQQNQKISNLQKSAIKVSNFIDDSSLVKQSV